MTSCSRATSKPTGNICHVRVHPRTSTNTTAHENPAFCALIERHSTASRQFGAEARDHGLLGPTALSGASGPAPTPPGRSVGPARSRPNCSRRQRPPCRVTKEEDQHLDQPPATRRCTGCSNAGETISGEGCCYGSKGCRIDVRDMLSGQGVKRSELWALLVRALHIGASGPVRGELSFRVLRVHKPIRSHGGGRFASRSCGPGPRTGVPLHSLPLGFWRLFKIEVF